MAKKQKVNDKLEEEKVEVNEEENENQKDIVDISEEDDSIEETGSEELEETEEDDDTDEYNEDEDAEEDEEEDDSNYELNPVKNTMSDKTRYIIIGVVTVLLLVLIVVLIVNGKDENNNNNNTKNSNITTERNTSTELLKEFYKQFDSEKLNVIYFASSTCGYCNLEKPIIEQISKDYDMDYYAIDASSLSDTEISEIISPLGISGATPTTVIVKDGEVVAKNEGYLDGKPYVEFFAKNGILDKDATYKEEDNLVLISYDDFKNLAKKDEESLVFLDTSACQDCITVRSLLNDLAKENDFKVNYLSAANLTQDDVNNLVKTDLKEMKYDDKTYKDEQQIKIPLLLIVKDNEIKDYVLESTEKSDYTKVLKKYKFIK